MKLSLGFYVALSTVLTLEASAAEQSYTSYPNSPQQISNGHYQQKEWSAFQPEHNDQVKLKNLQPGQGWSSRGHSIPAYEPNLSRIPNDYPQPTLGYPRQSPLRSMYGSESTSILAERSPAPLNPLVDIPSDPSKFKIVSVPVPIGAKTIRLPLSGIASKIKILDAQGGTAGSNDINAISILRSLSKTESAIDKIQLYSGADSETTKGNQQSLQQNSNSIAQSLPGFSMGSINKGFKNGVYNNPENSYQIDVDSGYGNRDTSHVDALATAGTAGGPTHKYEAEYNNLQPNLANNYHHINGQQDRIPISGPNFSNSQAPASSVRSLGNQSGDKGGDTYVFSYHPQSYKEQDGASAQQGIDFSNPEAILTKSSSATPTQQGTSGYSTSETPGSLVRNSENDSVYNGGENYSIGRYSQAYGGQDSAPTQQGISYSNDKLTPAESSLEVQKDGGIKPIVNSFRNQNGYINDKLYYFRYYPQTYTVQDVAPSEQGIKPFKNNNPQGLFNELSNNAEPYVPNNNVNSDNSQAKLYAAPIHGQQDRIPVPGPNISSSQASASAVSSLGNQSGNKDGDSYTVSYHPQTYKEQDGASAQQEIDFSNPEPILTRSSSTTPAQQGIGYSISQTPASLGKNSENDSLYNSGENDSIGRYPQAYGGHDIAPTQQEIGISNDKLTPTESSSGIQNDGFNSFRNLNGYINDKLYSVRLYPQTYTDQDVAPTEQGIKYFKNKDQQGLFNKLSNNAEPYVPNNNVNSGNSQAKLYAELINGQQDRVPIPGPNFSISQAPVISISRLGNQIVNKGGDSYAVSNHPQTYKEQNGASAVKGIDYSNPETFLIRSSFTIPAQQGAGYSTSQTPASSVRNSESYSVYNDGDNYSIGQYPQPYGGHDIAPTQQGIGYNNDKLTPTESSSGIQNDGVNSYRKQNGYINDKLYSVRYYPQTYTVQDVAPAEEANKTFKNNDQQALFNKLSNNAEPYVPNNNGNFDNSQAEFYAAPIHGQQDRVPVPGPNFSNFQAPVSSVSSLGNQSGNKGGDSYVVSYHPQTYKEQDGTSAQQGIETSNPEAILSRSTFTTPAQQDTVTSTFQTPASSVKTSENESVYNGGDNYSFDRYSQAYGGHDSAPIQQEIDYIKDKLTPTESSSGIQNDGVNSFRNLNGYTNDKLYSVRLYPQTYTDQDVAPTEQGIKYFKNKDQQAFSNKLSNNAVPYVPNNNGNSDNSQAKFYAAPVHGGLPLVYPRYFDNSQSPNSGQPSYELPLRDPPLMVDSKYSDKTPSIHFPLLSLIDEYGASSLGHEKDRQMYATQYPNDDGFSTLTNNLTDSRYSLAIPDDDSSRLTSVNTHPNDKEFSTKKPKNKTEDEANHSLNSGYNTISNSRSDHHINIEQIPTFKYLPEDSQTTDATATAISSTLQAPTSNKVTDKLPIHKDPSVVYTKYSEHSPPTVNAYNIQSTNSDKPAYKLLGYDPPLVSHHRYSDKVQSLESPLVSLKDEYETLPKTLLDHEKNSAIAANLNPIDGKSSTLTNNPLDSRNSLTGPDKDSTQLKSDNTNKTTGNDSKFDGSKKPKALIGYSVGYLQDSDFSVMPDFDNDHPVDTGSKPSDTFELANHTSAYPKNVHRHDINRKHYKEGHPYHLLNQKIEPSGVADSSINKYNNDDDDNVDYAMLSTQPLPSTLAPQKPLARRPYLSNSNNATSGIPFEIAHNENHDDHMNRAVPTSKYSQNEGIINPTNDQTSTFNNSVAQADVISIVDSQAPSKRLSYEDSPSNNNPINANSYQTPTGYYPTDHYHANVDPTNDYFYQAPSDHYSNMGYPFNNKPPNDYLGQTKFIKDSAGNKYLFKYKKLPGKMTTTTTPPLNKAPTRVPSDTHVKQSNNKAESSLSETPFSHPHSFSKRPSSPRRNKKPHRFYNLFNSHSSNKSNKKPTVPYDDNNGETDHGSSKYEKKNKTTEHRKYISENAHYPEHGKGSVSQNNRERYSNVRSESTLLNGSQNSATTGSTDLASSSFSNNSRNDELDDTEKPGALALIISIFAALEKLFSGHD